MGLLDKAEKKGLADIDISKIKKHVEKAIKKSENKVEEPKVQLKDNKIHVLRPEGALKEIKQQAKAEPKEEKKEVKPDFSSLKSIKAAIEAKLKRKPSQSATTPAKNRISTGIPGLDEVTNGGFRRGTVNLIAGGPGSGKTIFGMQFLMNGIDKYDEPGVYISFEQNEKELFEDMNSFGWNLEEKIKNKKLVILSYSPEQVEKVLKTGGGTVRDVIESISAKRVVIDSLTAFTLLHENQLEQRKACLDLFKAIKRWNCSALLLAEHEGNPELHSPTVEEFEVDAVILIYNIRKGDVRERALEIFKMRATKHSAKIFPMTITNDGMMIYPDQTVF